VARNPLHSGPTPESSVPAPNSGDFGENAAVAPTFRPTCSDTSFERPIRCLLFGFSRRFEAK
jgi:hypothetical protein